MKREKRYIYFQQNKTIESENEAFSVYLFRRSTKNCLLTFYLFNYVRVKRPVKSLLILILLIFCLQVNAQENWTLNECITYAVKNNLQLHQADLSEQIASQSYQRSKWNLLPGIFSEQAKTKLNQSKQNLLYEMEQNYNDLTAAWKELQQSRNQLEADKLSFQAAQKKFDQGMTNAIEFYTVKNRLASTASQVLHSKLTLEIKKLTLDFYKGTRFWQ